MASACVDRVDIGRHAGCEVDARMADAVDRHRVIER
jgi:hypothetical protein